MDGVSNHCCHRLDLIFPGPSFAFVWSRYGDFVELIILIMFLLLSVPSPAHCLKAYSHFFIHIFGWIIYLFLRSCPSGSVLGTSRLFQNYVIYCVIFPGHTYWKKNSDVLYMSLEQCTVFFPHIYIKVQVWMLLHPKKIIYEQKYKYSDMCIEIKMKYWHIRNSMKTSRVPRNLFRFLLRLVTNPWRVRNVMFFFIHFLLLTVF